VWAEPEIPRADCLPEAKVRLMTQCGVNIRPKGLLPFRGQGKIDDAVWAEPQIRKADCLSEAKVRLLKQCGLNLRFLSLIAFQRSR
jgi:hypothetical protein